MPTRAKAHQPIGYRGRPSELTRPTAPQRGYDHRWRKIRAAYLREHPLCVRCREQGRLEPATVVDHVIPHRGNADLFYDKANFAALCRRHHNQKTARGE